MLTWILSNADIAQQAITFQSDVTIQVGAGSTYYLADFNNLELLLDAGVLTQGPMY